MRKTTLISFVPILSTNGRVINERSYKNLNEEKFNASDATTMIKIFRIEILDHMKKFFR